MLNKNLSLVLFVALAVAGCAPKTTRKPITPGNTQSGQTGGDTTGGDNRPEARTSPSPTPPSPTPPNTDNGTPVAQNQPEPQPQVGPPAPQPQTPGQPQPEPQVGPTAPQPQTQAQPQPEPQVGPPAPQPQAQAQPQPQPQTQPQPEPQPQTQPQPEPQPQPQAQPQPQTQPPVQTLAQIGAPTTPTPEEESKPGLSKVLWMRLHGDGVTFEPEISIVASPPLKQPRSSEKQEDTGRTLFAEFDIVVNGKKTKGTSEFRHPVNGAIEKFNVTDATQEDSTEDLKNATEANKHTPMPFEIHIRVPIDEVTQDMLFTVADGFRDFARRDALVDQKIKDANESHQAKPDADALEKIQTELARIQARIEVIDGKEEEKRLDSKIRLGINKDRLAEIVLKPAHAKWKKMFYDDACVETSPDDLSRSNPPNCHGEFWIFNRQRDDIKEFYRYLDDAKNVERLVKEYLEATKAVKDEAKRQSQSTERAQAAGQAGAPMAPPPPAPSTALDFKIGEVRILKTNGQASGTALTQPNRVKLVFVGDAFTAAQAETFYTEAQKKWDYLFGNTATNQEGVEPFRTYRKYFMGIAIATESKQGKSCHPDQGDDCRMGHGRTALETQFGNFGIQRLLGMSKEGFRKIGNLLRANVPDFDLAAVIVNDTEYGGAGGQYALVSLDPNANEVIAHELMGHSFAKLGDEYTDPYPSYPLTEEANTMTDSTKADGKKWASHMLKNKSDLITVTPDEEDLISEVVQGAHYHADGWWRPFRACKMKTLGKPFCSVCRETIVKTIYNKIKPIDTVTTVPALNDKGALAVKASDSWSIKIATLQPEQPVDANATTSILKITWTLSTDKECKQVTPIDGAAGDTLTAETAKLKPGSYTVCAKVTDTNVDVTRLKLDLGAPNPLEQVRAFELRIN